MLKADFFSLGLKQQYTFDQLVVGTHNQMAAAASLQVSKNLGDAYNPLVIFGPTGVGKTHMMQSIAHAALARLPELKLKYISAERFVNDVISAISEDNLVGFRQHYNQLNLLLLDDVQYLMESRSAQGEFLHVFNNMHQQSCQVVLTSDCSPHQLEGLDKAIRSRLEWGLSADIKLPDHATRVEILKVKQKNFNLSLSDEAFHFVSEFLTSSVRELEGFLKRLHAYVTLSHQPITMALIKSVVMEIRPDVNLSQASPNPPQAPSSPPMLASELDSVLRTENTPVQSSGSPVTISSDPPMVLVPDLPSKQVNSPSVPLGPNSNGHGDPFQIALSQPPQPPDPTPPPVFSQVVPVEALEPPRESKTPSLPLSSAPAFSISDPKEMKESIPEVKKAPIIPPVVNIDSTDSSNVVPTPSPVPLTQPAKKEFVKAPIIPPTYVPDVEVSVVSSPAEIQPKENVAVGAPNVPEVSVVEDNENDPLPTGHKEIGAAFFFPAGGEPQLESVFRKFQDVIKKHKLKFRLKRMTNHPYQYKGKINYTEFVDVCRNNKVPVAIVVGPPSDGGLSDQEFYDLLSVTLDVQGVSLQLVTWNEIDKDYRYLNLALDIALVRAR